MWQIIASFCCGAGVVVIGVSIVIYRTFRGGWWGF